MATSTVEDYVKQIYFGQERAAGRLVPMGWLAAAVGVTPGTATTMVKTLADAGLVRYAPRGGTRLTRKGEQLALHVLRRHRLIELFLVNVLDVDWSDVHKEAEELEHAISAPLLEKIAAHLGHPELDPHGDPIPQLDGSMASRHLIRLIDSKPGQTCRVAQVLDQDARFLRFVQRQGLKPGSKLTVERHDAMADAIAVRLASRRTITLGTAAAAKILVTSE